MKLITSKENSLIKHLLKLKSNKSYRYAQKKVLIEGFKMIKELSFHLPILRLFVTKECADIKISTHETFIFTPSLIKKLSSLQSSEGILAEVEIPPFYSTPQGEKILIVDGIQDPGNLGTLFRTALALNWDHIILLENSVDPYNDKALRSAKGSTFILPISKLTWDATYQWLEKKSIPLLIADISGSSPQSFTHLNSLALLLSREGSGPIRTLSEHKKISIPMNTKIESLNVATAGAILMYTLGTHNMEHSS